MSAEYSPGDQNPQSAQPGADGAAPDGTAPEAGLDLQAQLAAAEAKVQEHYDALLRARAEAENARRRAQEEVAKAHKFGIESFAESLVPVKDSLEAALTQQNATLESWREGVEATLRQLAGAFERHKLGEIAPQPGERFDPHQHQAIASVPSDAQPANTVLQTLQKGYLIADRVLRPALVTVVAPK